MTIIGTIVVVILWLSVFQFLTGFQCGTHFSALWDGNYEKYCTISFPFLYGLAVSDFLLDIWILSLPIPRVLQLNAALPKRLAILGVFFLTFVSVFASGARMVQYILAERGGPDYFIKHDEERVSLVAVNLPSLWFLVASISPDKILQLSLSSPQSDNSRAPSHDDPTKA
ncbi:hypothetical protein F5Y13DRAFT_186135 [Hypoxylon sp. FL1857]|nr:hypothetical protein F5Y13DRAFT_186135 [Hypoxylon sp. FL1857]